MDKICLKLRSLLNDLVGGTWGVIVSYCQVHSLENLYKVLRALCHLITVIIQSKQTIVVNVSLALLTL